jgi:hypothetical protein
MPGGFHFGPLIWKYWEMGCPLLQPVQGTSIASTTTPSFVV